MDARAEDDLSLHFEKGKQEGDHLPTLKHVSEDFNRWITPFEDQVKACETVGVVPTKEAKIFYFKASFMELSMRISFSDTYVENRQRVIAEYGRITSRNSQTMLEVIKTRTLSVTGETSFKAEEEGCHVCGMPVHLY